MGLNTYWDTYEGHLILAYTTTTLTNLISKALQIPGLELMWMQGHLKPYTFFWNVVPRSLGSQQSRCLQPLQRTMWNFWRFMRLFARPCGWGRWRRSWTSNVKSNLRTSQQLFTKTILRAWGKCLLAPSRQIGLSMLALTYLDLHKTSKIWESEKVLCMCFSKPSIWLSSSIFMAIAVTGRLTVDISHCGQSRPTNMRQIWSQIKLLHVN